ncbi:efflux transporter outer membrane subunit [Pedobacter sp. P351]|uniref:efflux transporter outer membrane subunit n=1 Tax=Pedobacter superstes TaxID=3133441 RepID=UPI0030A4C41C
MNNLYKNLFLFFALALMALSSCKVTQRYASPEVNTQNLYRNLPSGDTSTIADLPWKQLFTDTALQALIEEGISNNLDLKIAFTRVQQSEAYYKQSRAAFLPGVNANAGLTFNKLSDAQGGGFINNNRVFQAGLSSSWEADIWGKLGSSKRAGMASLLQNKAYSRAVQTSIVATIANYYYSLLALDQQLAITEQTVKNWIQSVETMRALKEAAVVTGAAVVQSEANQYAVEVTIPDLKQSIRELENALSIVLGRAPGAINRSGLDQQSQPSVFNTGIPSQLLSRRPDVQQAEYNFRYYFENTNMAKTFFYPSLTITASGGLSNTAIKDFFNPGSVFASLAGGLAQPIFNRRINKTRLEVAKAAQQEALFSFQNSLLEAGQEVSDAMSDYQTAVEKNSVRSKQLASLQKSIEFTRELLKYGSANYTEVINAQQSYLSAQLNRVNDKQQQLQAVVELYRALGGGWK